MRAISGDGRGRVRAAVRVMLSMCVVASALTIVVAAPPSADADSAGSYWYIGPNVADSIANDVTYYGQSITPRFYGLVFRTVYSGQSAFTWKGTEYPPLWIDRSDGTSTVSVNIPGAIIEQRIVQDPYGNGAGPGISIGCADYSCAAGMSSFEITFSYSDMVRSNACVLEWERLHVGSYEEACPLQLVQGTQTRTVIAGPEPSEENLQPNASFTATQSSTDRYEWSFDSQSSDDRDALASLGHSWDFGDGATSTERNPTHRYEESGEHRVTLTVTVSGGLRGVSSQDLTTSSGLVVNSTGDLAAIDPEERGCDTGDEIGDDPE